MEWQPIETAPHNWPLLLFFLRLGEETGVYGIGNRSPDGLWQYGDIAYSAAPTHWMPLPAPPEAK